MPAPRSDKEEFMVPDEMPLKTRFLSTINSSGMVGKNDHVSVAISGGPDGRKQRKYYGIIRECGRPFRRLPQHSPKMGAGHAHNGVGIPASCGELFPYLGERSPLPCAPDHAPSWNIPLVAAGIFIVRSEYG